MTDNYGGSYPGGGAPGAPPPPMGPGPGGMPPQQAPYYPQPQPQGSQTWKVLLIGCLILVLLGAIALGGMCYFVAKNSDEIVSKGLDAQKTEYLKMFSADHTGEQQERFSSLHDAMVYEYKRLGMIEWSMKYSESLSELQAIAVDGEITVEESDTWCGNMEATLEAAGYFDQPE